MKEYNRKTKNWEEPTGKGKFKARDTCRGGKEHNYLLTLPDYITRLYLGVDEITPEAILEYYKHIERVKEFESKEEKILNVFGIKGVSLSSRSNMRYYICSVCGKRDYKYE